MDIAPKYAGIVMGLSNAAGKLDGVVGVSLTGKILDAAKNANMNLSIGFSSSRFAFACSVPLCS